MICSEFEKCVAEYAGSNNEQCKKCRIESSNSNIACSENGRRYNLRNDKKLSVTNFLIDGGVYKEDSHTKCDRLYIVKDSPMSLALFIELKGKTIIHALEQLEGTALRHKSVLENKRVAFRVVCTGAPKIATDPDVLTIKKRLYKEFSTLPVIKENSLDEKYSTIKG